MPLFSKSSARSALLAVLLLLPTAGSASKPCEYWPYEKLYDSSDYVGEIRVQGDSAHEIESLKTRDDFKIELGGMSGMVQGTFIKFLRFGGDSLDRSVCLGEMLLQTDSTWVYFQRSPLFDNLAAMDYYQDRVFSPDRMDKAAFKQAIRDELPVKKPRAEQPPNRSGLIVGLLIGVMGAIIGIVVSN